MSIPNYRRFLSECIIYDPAQRPGLREDEMYGLYMSWCLMNREQPAGDELFWAAMSNCGLHRRRVAAGTSICPGVGMTGPAAVDYILSSQPSLV